MSYPGYNPYQQVPPQAMPGMPSYPQQSQPYGQMPPMGAPYPDGQPSPYPSSESSPYPQSMQPPYSGGSAPYPQQQSYSSYGQAPSGQSPYPSANVAYPPQSFGQPAPYPTQFASGFGFNAPTYMPMPQHVGQAPPMGGVSSPMGQVPPQMGRAPSPMRPFPPAPTASNDPFPESIARPSHYGSLGSAPPVHGHSSHHIYKPKYSPTVLPAEPFDPRSDAEILRKAMKGFGTDEKAIISVLANRTNPQRLEIGIQFKTLYGKDLIKNLKSEVSGRFEDLLVAMMTPLPQFYAQEIHDALGGIGTDEDCLIEVFCTMNNNELCTIRAAYETMYHSSLEGDLSGDTSGTFRRLMVSLCTANRDESMVVNPEAVTRDAQALLQAGELRMGTDESTFNAILCQRNYAHLQHVFEEYQRITGHDMEEAIKNEFSGDAEEGLLAVARSIKDKAQFFARRLHQSMKGMGTNDKQLIRLIITRSEVDMGDIKNAYQAKYGETLADAISSDCSGDYKKCLLALINI